MRHGASHHRGGPRQARRLVRLAMVLVCSALLLVGATEVTGAARAGADALPNCATTPETTTEGCGYYINQSGVVGGTPVLAGESSATPNVLTVGGPLEQTATVMTNPGVFDVTITAYGPISSYSPQDGDGITVTVDGTQVTWTQPVTNGFTAFSAGQTFTLDSTASSLGVGTCTLCASLGVQWNYGIGGNPSGYSQTPYMSVGAGGTPPTASFTDTADTTVPGAVDFDGSASTPSPGATLESYIWNFGDGSPPVTTTAPTTTHTYAAPGSQQVTLTVKDSAGLAASLTKTLQFPVPAFSYVPDPANPKALDFDASASAGSGGTAVATYTWNFGDGSQPVSTHSATTTYAYASGGVYTVTLSVTDTDGHTSPLLAKQVTVAAYEVNSVGDAPREGHHPARLRHRIHGGGQFDDGAGVHPACRHPGRRRRRSGRHHVQPSDRGDADAGSGHAAPDDHRGQRGDRCLHGDRWVPGDRRDRPGPHDGDRPARLRSKRHDPRDGRRERRHRHPGRRGRWQRHDRGEHRRQQQQHDGHPGGSRHQRHELLERPDRRIGRRRQELHRQGQHRRLHRRYLHRGQGLRRLHRRQSVRGLPGDLEPVFIDNASGNFIGAPSSSPGQAPGNIIDGETVFTQAAGSRPTAARPCPPMPPLGRRGWPSAATPTGPTTTRSRATSSA